MNNHYKARIGTIVALILLIGFTVQAQRPKIGLTLSGGGAKGLAHVGILMAIDSAGLEVDYITGTSMGSIIGGMYAVGYSGKQINEISKKLDWNVLLSGKPQYKDISIDEKDEFGRYSAEIPFKDGKPYLGTGLIESEEIWLQFSEIFFSVYDQKDFSKFNIPFKCIATNLSTGEAVVLDTGEVVMALRSSMAIPSVLNPVVTENMHLVDGGIVRNFPVSDVREMGADIVIGVNLFKGLSEAENLGSALDVMYQITNYRDAIDLVKQKELCDILINPPVDDYSAGSFGDADTLLQIGYEMGRQYYPYFKHLADSLNALQKKEYNPETRFAKKDWVAIDDIKVDGLVYANETELLKEIGLRKGEQYSSSELKQIFHDAYGSLLYKFIYYELKPTTEGHCNMVIKVNEQQPNALKMGLSYHSFSTPALLINYTMRNFLINRSRLYVKVALSEDLKIRVDEKIGFGSDNQHLLRVNAQFVQQGLPIYDDDYNSPKYIYNTDNVKVGGSYQYLFNYRSMLSFDLHYRKTYFSPDVANDFRYEGDMKDLLGGVQFHHNSLDRLFLPTDGMLATAGVGVEFARSKNIKYAGTEPDTTNLSDSSFNNQPHDPLLRIQFKFAKYKTLVSNTTLFSDIQGGLLSNENNFVVDNFMIGGMQQLYGNQITFSGYKDGQFIATSFVSASIGAMQKIYGELYVIGKANFGVANLIQNFEFIEDPFRNFITGFSASIAHNNSLLPIEFSFNYSPEREHFFSSVRIGYLF